MRTASMIAVGAILLMKSIATAQESAPRIQCFEVINSASNAVPFASILLDKCSGHTWMLVRQRTGDNQTAYRWVPISVSNSGESTWTENAPSPLPQAKKGN